MRTIAVKEFEIREGSTANSWYEIGVYFKDDLVENFLKPTMSEARSDFERAGYRRIDWAWRNHYERGF